MIQLSHILFLDTMVCGKQEEQTATMVTKITSALGKCCQENELSLYSKDEVHISVPKTVEGSYPVFWL